MRVNTTFSHEGFSALFSNANNLSLSVPNPGIFSLIARALPSISQEIHEPITVPSIPELVGIEYLGYVIEKERFDPNTRDWIKIDEYRLIGTNSNTFRDTRIAYGFTYRYRMKTVLKLTVKKEVPSLDGSPDLNFEHVSLYFESYPRKKWTIVDVLETLPPPYPQTIKVVADSLKRQVTIFWLKPPSRAAGDIKFYNVYKRNEVGQAWYPVASNLREKDTLFIDRNVGFNTKYIYAITTVDVHGTESFLSAQLSAELNSNIAIEKKEKDIKWVSGGGARVDEPYLVLKKFNERKEKIVAMNTLSIRPNTKFKEQTKDFIIKVKSLDTHEEYELKVTLKNSDITAGFFGNI